jgi:FtsZ-binding cell division protein ZapB
MPTPEEYEVQIKELTAGWEASKTEVTTLTSAATTTAAENKIVTDKLEADLIAASQSPTKMQVEIEALRDAAAKQSVEMEEVVKKAAEHETLTSNLAEAVKAKDDTTAEIDKLRGRVRGTLLGTLTGPQHGLDPKTLESKDLASLEVIAEALQGQTIKPVGPGLGLESDSGGSGGDKPLTAIQIAEREIATLKGE